MQRLYYEFGSLVNASSTSSGGKRFLGADPRHQYRMWWDYPTALILTEE